MRLWSLHPKYLDTQGLLAVWREGLLAKHVLQGKTKGYTNHPQLDRFLDASDPVEAIDQYLYYIYLEAKSRGYKFDASKCKDTRCETLPVTNNQIFHEVKHLRKKLEARDPDRIPLLEKLVLPEVNPLFDVIIGPVADWEKVKSES